MREEEGDSEVKVREEDKNRHVHKQDHNQGSNQFSCGQEVHGQVQATVLPSCSGRAEHKDARTAVAISQRPAKEQGQRGECLTQMPCFPEINQPASTSYWGTPMASWKPPICCAPDGQWPHLQSLLKVLAIPGGPGNPRWRLSF